MHSQYTVIRELIFLHQEASSNVALPPCSFFLPSLSLLHVARGSQMLFIQNQCWVFLLLPLFSKHRLSTIPFSMFLFLAPNFCLYLSLSCILSLTCTLTVGKLPRNHGVSEPLLPRSHFLSSRVAFPGLKLLLGSLCLFRLPVAV